jgi:hypothetical protein
VFELDATGFVSVVTEVRRLCTIMEQDLGGADEHLTAGLRDNISQTVVVLCNNLTILGVSGANSRVC